MYFHVVKNVQRSGKKGYLHTKTYHRYANLEKYLLKTGEPYWVIESSVDYLPHVPYRNDPSQPCLFGGFIASYWNSGGWGSAPMPIMELF